MSALPEPPTPLVGRHDDVACVVDLLSRPEVRLVTLTGPGGTGKTRLALAAADQLAASFSDGALWVELAPITDPEVAISAIAQAAGARARSRASRWS